MKAAKVPEDLLGIYIPTYNRSDKLRGCLEVFISQIKRYGFTIYISDNSSNSETEEMVKRLRRKYQKIVYTRNRKNIGYALNVRQVLLMGKSKYVWLFGDDDEIKKGAMDVVVKNLMEGYEFLQINLEYYDKDLSRKIMERAMKFYDDIVYYPGMHNQVLLNAGHASSGFLASMITRRQDIIRELRKLKPEKISGFDYIQALLFFKAIVGRKGKLIAEPLINYRTDNNAKPGRAIEYGIASYYEFIKALRPEYSEAVIRKVGTADTMYLMGLMARLRQENPQEIKRYRKIVSSSENIGFGGKTMLMSVSYMPRSAIGIGVWTFRKIKGLPEKDRTAESRW